MTKPTLLVLAAGMGSRYGGLKQIDPMGPEGETMLDYSVYDAARAGFGRVVFVIREDFESDFKMHLGRRFQKRLPVDYCYQRIDDLPAGYTPPEGRSKPWGTAHAVLAAQDIVQEPFAVINADDFYGCDAYKIMAAHLQQLTSATELHMAMVGYSLYKTLSPYGSVNRGLCQVEKGLLVGVQEYVNIQKASGGLSGENTGGQQEKLAPEATVSMNFWGFTSEIFEHLEKYFTDFLNKQINEPKSECYLPAAVDAFIQEGIADCPVLTANSQWFGVTYPEDKKLVQVNIRILIEEGFYPESLV